MKKFVILIDGDNKFAELSPAEIESTVQKYSAWAKKLKDENRLVDAEGLTKQVHVLVGGPNGVITDGPFPETKEMIGGYYVYMAESFDEAVEIARECPALGYGGSVEIRAVMDYS